MQVARFLPPAQAASSRLAGAVDAYVVQLRQLGQADPEHCASRLAGLAEAMRAIRLCCNRQGAVHAACVELLIGHSEITYNLSLTRGRTGRARIAAMVTVQAARAEALLCIAGTGT